MIMSPVNPSDLLVVRAGTACCPTLPATPGFEGVGVVDEVGPGSARPRWSRGSGSCVDQRSRAGTGPSTRSSPPGRRGRCPPISRTSRWRRLSSTRRPCWRMVRHVLKVPEGEWLLQSAAGSTLGRMMIKLGRHDGFKTLNVVRRREAIDELKALGGDAVISSEDGPIDEQVRRIVGERRRPPRHRPGRRRDRDRRLPVARARAAGSCSTAPSRASRSASIPG